jgi:ribonuclease HI
MEALIIVPDIDAMDMALLRIWKMQQITVAPSKLAAGDLSQYKYVIDWNEVDFDNMNTMRIAQNQHVLWYTLNKTSIFFTDGSCFNNGKVNARGGFACVVMSPYRARSFISGQVQKYKYILRDNKLDVDVDNLIKPSNNRGEMLGIISALMNAVHDNITNTIIIVTDSKWCINTLEKWYPARLKTKKTHEMKNLDLIEIAWEFLQKIENVSIEFCRSHQKEPPKFPKRTHLMWTNNGFADILAKDAANSTILTSASVHLRVDDYHH